MNFYISNCVFTSRPTTPNDDWSLQTLVLLLTLILFSFFCTMYLYIFFMPFGNVSALDSQTTDADS